MHLIRWSCMKNNRLAVLLLTLIVVGIVGWSTSLAADPKSDTKNTPKTNGGDEADRSMAFVEKTVQATNLFNDRKLPEALKLFQELSQKYSDLDEDGYAAMGLADCLHAMARDGEARKVYQAVAVKHADLKATANMRIREIDLASGDVSDALIEDLRHVAGTAGEQRVSAQLQLGRALQKRAVALLREAVATFRRASEEDRHLAHPVQRTISNQAVLLAEIQEDLASLVNRVENTWGLARTLGEILDSGSLEHTSGDADMADYQAKWRAEASTGKQASVQAAWGKGQATPRITVDGREIKLNSTQALVIQRHQQRINAIVQEASQSEQAQADGTHK